MPIPANLEHRILALARDLAADIDTVTLDTIDGEFFWRVCQEQIAALFAAHVTPFPPWPSSEEDMARAFESAGDVRDAHRDAWRNITSARPDLILMVPDPVVTSLLAGERVSMRPANVSSGSDRLFPGEDTLEIQVRSGAWTGSDVERAIMQRLRRDPWLASHAFGTHPLAVPDHRFDNVVAVRIAFEAFGDLTFTEDAWAFWGPCEFPYIEVTVPLPLPAPGMIGSQYDAIVREQHGWHQQLPGGIPNGQQKPVAIRTWAVSLLMAAGHHHHDAMREVCTHTSLKEISQSCFGDDRRLLLKRVPEALPYIKVVR